MPIREFFFEATTKNYQEIWRTQA